MKALVVGGSGFLGKALITRLYREGFEVINLDIVKNDELPSQIV